MIKHNLKINYVNNFRMEGVLAFVNCEVVSYQMKLHIFFKLWVVET
jgi:hypothetical protein